MRTHRGDSGRIGLADEWRELGRESVEEAFVVTHVVHAGSPSSARRRSNARACAMRTAPARFAEHDADIIGRQATDDAQFEHLLLGRGELFERDAHRSGLLPGDHPSERLVLVGRQLSDFLTDRDQRFGANLVSHNTLRRMP